MKQYQIINAYKAAEKLAECELDPKEQWKVYKLRQFLRPHIEFRTEQEEKIRKKYIEFADDKGNLSGQKAAEYYNDLNELNNVEIEIEDREKPKIQFVKGITCKISEPLEDFIEFTEPAE